MSAIELAIQRPEMVSKLQLISPAPPLELGDFLPSMAGKPIFTAAIKSKILFGTLTTLQGIVVRLAPKYLIKSMFANSPKTEQALLDDPDFVTMLKHGLRHSLCSDTKSYRAAVLRYV